MNKTSLVARLWRDYVSRHLSEVLLLLPALATVAAAGVSYALILKYTTDEIGARNAAVVLWAPLAVLAATGVRAVALWAQAIISQSIALKVLRDLQTSMFAKLMDVDFARHAREEPGRLVSRFTNDINIVSEALVRGGQSIIRDTLTLIGAVASMIWFDWVLTLVVAGAFLIAAGPLQQIAKRALKQTHVAQEQMGALSALLMETFSFTRAVKTYGLEDREKTRAAAAFEDRRKIAMKLAYSRARTVPLMEIVGGVALAGVLWIAGYRILNDTMTLGDLMGMIGAVGVAAPAARALQRVFGLIDEPVTIVDKPNAKPLAVNEGRVTFENVSFSYGQAPALNGVSFSVAPGETVAFVGPSGAGKSTIFNLLPRLYDATDGSVRIDGQDVRDVQVASVRQAISLVAQEAALFNDTIRANIALGRPGASHAQIEEAARNAAAHDFITELPNGYDTIAGDRGANLSGGERQRIALARAFLRDAPILLLDEATSALDAESEAKIQEALARLSKGRTVLVIAHRLATVRDADRILTLEDGRVVESGTHDALVARGGLYARLSRLQFQSEAAE
jgi:ATP-binding cassette, subfamily B, bacterial MsbA